MRTSPARPVFALTVSKAETCCSSGSETKTQTAPPTCSLPWMSAGYGAQAGISRRSSRRIGAARPRLLPRPDGQWFGFPRAPASSSQPRCGRLEDTQLRGPCRPEVAGRVCIRSSATPNLSLVGSMIAHGAGESPEWVWSEGQPGPRSRRRHGLLTAAAAGECDIAVANTYTSCG